MTDEKITKTTNEVYHMLMSNAAKGKSININHFNDIRVAAINGTARIVAAMIMKEEKKERRRGKQ